MRYGGLLRDFYMVGFSRSHLKVLCICCHAMAVLFFFGLLGCVNDEKDMPHPVYDADALLPFVSDLYLSEYADYRIMTPCLSLDYCALNGSGDFRYKIQDVPKMCKALWIRGNCDFSDLGVSPTLEYATFVQTEHVHPRHVQSLAFKLPNLKVLEFEDGGVDETMSHGVNGSFLDLGVFSKMGKLRHLNLLYNGCVANSNELIDNLSINRLKLTVVRQLPRQSASPRDDCCDDISDSSSWRSYDTDVKWCIRNEKNTHFNNGVKTFVIENMSANAVEIPRIPDCCRGLSIKGRFTFSSMPLYPNILSLCWYCDKIEGYELSSLDFARFPNLRALFIGVETCSEQQLDFSDVDVCSSLECVEIDCLGNCVVRNIERVFESDRIWLFIVSFERNRSNPSDLL